MAASGSAILPTDDRSESDEMLNKPARMKIALGGLMRGFPAWARGVGRWPLQAMTARARNGLRIFAPFPG
jgi:hypothetical protein